MVRGYDWLSLCPGTFIFSYANEPEQRLMNLPVGRKVDKQSAANLIAIMLDNQNLFVKFLQNNFVQNNYFRFQYNNT